jgi:hypothetical protein
MYCDGLLRALRCFQERNAGLNLDVFSNHNLLLERVSGATSRATKRIAAAGTGEMGEQVIDVNVGTEPSLATEPAKTAEPAEWAATGKRIATSGLGLSVGIEAGSTKLVKLLPLLGVGQDLVCGLDVAELVLGTRVLVCVGVVFLG